MAWQSDNSSTWYKRFLRAFWDSTRYNWNDTNLLWDAISDDGWQEANEPDWHS